MSVWIHTPLSRPTDSNLRAYLAAHYTTNEGDSGWYEELNKIFNYPCDFCKTPLRPIDKVYETFTYQFRNLHDFACLYVCPSCGWWSCVSNHGTIGGKSDEFTPTLEQRNDFASEFGLSGLNVGFATSHLRTLDLRDLKNPLTEVKDYLRAKYEKRFDLHPRLFEEIVGSVFTNEGYQVSVTSYSNDGGIDAILHDSDGTAIGVQVKRYKNDISVSQIREFLGALVLNGFTKGVFVTTSRFQKGAYEVVGAMEKKGVLIRLMDNGRFFDALGMTRRPEYSTIDEWVADFAGTSLEKIAEILAPWSGIA